MRNEWQQFEDETVRRASLPGAPAGPYGAGPGIVQGNVAEPGFAIDATTGQAVRYFLPGRSPFYKPGAARRYILGRPKHG